MKINYEIFDKWWEYFLVAWWSVSPPKNKKLLNRENVTNEDISSNYLDKVKTLISNGDKSRIDNFIAFIDKRCEDEYDRKKIIEDKAHSLIGQTGITITLLIGTLSLGTTQFNEWHISLKLMIWFIFVAIIVNFVVAGLHARNVVTLSMGYGHQDFDSFLENVTNSVDIILEKIKISHYNSYLNDVKATYLRFAQWYYKSSFLLILLGALILPSTIICINTSASKNENTGVKKISNPNSKIHNNFYENNYLLDHDTLMIKNDQN